MTRLSLLPFLLLLAILMGVWTASAQDDPACPGAPLPRLVVGALARVLPGDANNVRDAASRNGALVGSIPGGEVFNVLEGPVCADGLNWWSVDYDGLLGWTVEGSGSEYWLEPYDPAAVTPEPTAAPTAEPTSTPVPQPVTDFEPPIEAVNVLGVGVQARVINDDPDSDTVTLTVRAEPGRDGGPVAQAQEGDLLTIIGGPEEVDGLRWWQVETEGGSTGWVVEGLVNSERENAYERTLLAICPAEGERVAYRVMNYIVTSATDGSEPCVLDYLSVPAWTTFTPYTARFDNHFVLSPDGQYVLYEDSTLYRLKLDGSERLALNTGAVWAAWSPDGQRIAVATGSQIATMRADGSLFSALTQGEGKRSWVQWLADSETVLYMEQSRWQDQMGTAIEYTFYRINTQEGGLREILHTPLAWDLYGIEVSPDGTLLAVSAIEYSLIDGMQGTEPVKFYDLSLPDGQHTQIIDLETGEVVLASDMALYNLKWLPEGSALINVGYGSEESLQVIPVNGDEPYEVELSGDTVPEDYREFLGWESDTVFLTYSGYGFQIEPSDFGIWAVDVTNGEVERRP